MNYCFEIFNSLIKRVEFRNHKMPARY